MKNAAEQAAADKAAADKAATDKAATDKAATEKAATEKAATDKAATEQAAADKAAADSESRSGGQLVAFGTTVEVDEIAVIKGKATVFVAKNGLHISQNGKSRQFRAGAKLYRTVKGKKTEYYIR